MTSALLRGAQGRLPVRPGRPVQAQPWRGPGRQLGGGVLLQGLREVDGVLPACCLGAAALARSAAGHPGPSNLHPAAAHTPKSCLKDKVVQGNQSFLTFERYFQNFHRVFDQLCDLLRWQFFVIVNGCPCVIGPGGGVFFTLFNLCKKCSKTSRTACKKFFELFFDV